MTYNVHSFGNEITGFSAKEFAEMMNKEETDVLCFQEYRGNGDFTEQDLQNTYAKIFPYSFIPEGLSQAIYSRYPIRQSQNNRISEYQQRSHLGRPGCKRYDDTHHQRAHADYQL